MTCCYFCLTHDPVLKVTDDKVASSPVKAVPFILQCSTIIYYKNVCILNHTLLTVELELNHNLMQYYMDHVMHTSTMCLAQLLLV